MILKTDRNIVDILLDIMDEGPTPMKNLKATEKNRNCVDQFFDAHQAEYEARGRQSNDDVEKVNQYNSTYPRLGDELDRRKSLSMVRTNQKKNDSSKRSYLDLRQHSSPVQKNTIKYNQRKIKTKTRSRDIKSRVRKNGCRTKKGISRLLKTISVNKMSKCRCCYVHVKHKRVGNDMSPFFYLEAKNIKKSDTSKDRMGSSCRIDSDGSKERMISRERRDNILPNERMNDLKSEDGKSEQSSIKTLKNPDTSIASVSSYNTYLSLDHEPMVNMEL